ncbi:peptidylprolyl isomerase [Motilibacter peucedani]|uniref:peptidylprolyl isomerase n=1 Tax=Motilibacter peucedani TaxID=598650 RepID=A0A420XTM0_9ACTN|nr:FKBP-type peptidyl-prolyl cis-trans isomerase [Motilibacter peucedani]RKS80107.1 peptidylprolyl isomerase [Motilibacter peucedani]
MRRLAVLALSGSFLLAACGASSSPDAGSSAASPGSSAPSSSAPSSSAPGASADASGTPAPKVPISTEVGFTASGAYGDKPTLTFTGKPGTSLGVKVVTPGTGAVVKAGDILDADYLGQVWGGKVFDNSYDKGTGAAFPIGTGKVISGWDRTLVGLKAGSRVLLSIPPSEGYGSGGQSEAGIKGTDTIVFVVDIVGTYSKTAASDPKAVDQGATVPSTLTITGKPGSPAKVVAAKDYKAPAKAKMTVLAKGTGKPVTTAVLVQYAAAQAGGATESSWDADGPQTVPVSDAQAGPFQLLKGVPVGSRVLLEVPADTTNGQAAAVFVVDLVGIPQSAKQARG